MMIPFPVPQGRMCSCARLDRHRGRGLCGSDRPVGRHGGRQELLALEGLECRDGTFASWNGES